MGTFSFNIMDYYFAISGKSYGGEVAEVVEASALLVEVATEPV